MAAAEKETEITTELAIAHLWDSIEEQKIHAKWLSEKVASMTGLLVDQNQKMKYEFKLKNTNDLIGSLRLAIQQLTHKHSHK